MTAGMIKILLVEDDQVDRMALERLIQNHELRCEYRMASSLEEARDVLKTEQFDVAVMADCRDDEAAFEAVAFEVAAMYPDLPVIITSGNSNAGRALWAEQAGVSAYLIKDRAGEYLEALLSAISRIIQSKLAQ